MVSGAAAGGRAARRRREMRKKLERAGATSKETAVTIEEAGFDEIEKKWLGWFVSLGKIKKTIGDNGKDRYYIEPSKEISWW